MERGSDRALILRELARRELARKSYRRYLWYVQGESWKRTKVSNFLADRIQRFVEEDTGNAYDILILMTPPQHGKSVTVTESFPSWYMGKNPKKRVIVASYSEETAKRFGRKNLDKLARFGTNLFGVDKGSVWTATELELSNGWGRMISRGIMSGITGNPADLLIIDDPIKNREEADSSVYRDKLWDEWQSTLKTRFAAGAKVILIATPWHEDDLLARVRRYEPNVQLLRLPVEAEENDPLGRKPGDPLAPELGKDKKWLRQFKAGYESDPRKGGRRAWQALYQCSPRVEGGALVKRDWWKYFDPEKTGGFAATCISVDAAFKDGEENDFVAIEVWSKKNCDYYLRYCLNSHLNFPATVKTVRQVRELFPDCRYVLIEDKANGSAVIQTLRHEVPGVLPVEPKGGKTARVNAVAPAIEGGHVFLPREKLWAQELVDQFSAFPAGKHDDMVDAASQALSFLLWSAGEQEPLPDSREQNRRAGEEREQRSFLGDGMYAVYG